MNFHEEVADRMPNRIGNHKDRFVVYWDDGGRVLVVPWPDVQDFGRDYQNSGYDAWLHIRRAKPKQRGIMACQLADKLMIEYKCDPREVVEQFQKIPEFREFLSGFGKIAFRDRKARTE